MKHKFKESKFMKTVAFRSVTIAQLEEIRQKTETGLSDNEIIAAAVAHYHKEVTQIPLTLCEVCGAKYATIIGHCPKCSVNAEQNADNLLEDITGQTPDPVPSS